MISRRRLRGLSVIELLLAIVITSIMTIIVGAVFVASLRLWRDCSVRAQKFPPAFIVLDRINKEARGAVAVQVTPTQVWDAPAAMDSTIIISIPQKDPTTKIIKYDPNQVITNNYQGMTTDYRVKYYLTKGDPALFPNRKAGENLPKRLYRVTLAAGTDTQLNTPELITDNVMTLNCSTSAVSNGRVLTLYATAATLQGDEEGYTYNHHDMKKSIAYKNLQSTVTATTAFRTDL